jgi:hypothetical protein
MKAISCVLSCILTFFISGFQEVDLIGSWSMFEMTCYSSEMGKQEMTEQQMKNNHAVTQYIFMDGGKFRQISNMSGTGSLDTFDGSWKLDKDNLTISLITGESTYDQVWKAEYDHNVLKLSHTDPTGAITIINSFRRK